MGEDTADPKKRANKTGFRVVFAAFLAVTVSFIFWTAFVVIRQVFVETNVPSRGEVLPALPPACERGLKTLGDSLALGIRAALWAEDEESAARMFSAAIAPAWRDHEQVGAACRPDPAGTGAYAALVRQRRVQEGWARRHARETVAAVGGARRFLPLPEGR